MNIEWNKTAFEVDSTLLQPRLTAEWAEPVRNHVTNVVEAEHTVLPSGKLPAARSSRIQSECRPTGSL